MNTQDSHETATFNEACLGLNIDLETCRWLVNNTLTLNPHQVAGVAWLVLLDTDPKKAQQQIDGQLEERCSLRSSLP